MSSGNDQVDSEKTLVANAWLRFEKGRWSLRSPPLKLEANVQSLLPALEQFVWPRTVSSAKQAYAQARTDPVSPVALAAAQEVCELLRSADVIGEFFVGRDKFVAGTSQRRNHINLLDASRQSQGQVFRAILGSDHDRLADLQPMWNEVCAELCRASVLAPSPGTLDWGDVSRLAPLCYRFGFSRGGAVDRVYTDMFRQTAQSYVSGDCLEIGPLGKGQRDPLLRNASRYSSLDVDPSRGSDLVGSICSPDVLPAESFDTVVALHVLEHVATPQLAVDHLYQSLRAGGRALVCCPSVQRRHGFPGDYWRPMPAGLAYLFRGFTEVTTMVYGNVLTSVAALMGAAPEELPPGAFEYSDPNYPVLSCVVARK